MDSQTIVILALGVLVLLGLAAFVYAQRQKTERLRTKYGPEYERVVADYGQPGAAAAELARREKRVGQLQIRALDVEERAHFAEAWRAEQARFVDEPEEAVIEADRLVSDVMMARGYPVTDFDQRAADVSVDHPRVVENYRAAREIAQRQRSGGTNTEELRQAMVHYRVLFADLLDDGRESRAETVTDRPEVRQ